MIVLAHKKIGKTEAVSQHVVYIGPSIPRLVQSNTAFAGALPERLEQWVLKHSLFQSFIIPASELAAGRKELTAPGTALSRLYDEAVRIINNKQRCPERRTDV